MGRDAAATLLPTSIVQHWRPDASQRSSRASPHLILSPANRLYLDMKYDDDTLLGLNWAGNVSVRTGVRLGSVGRKRCRAPDEILGVEAPLWSETLANMRDVEYMAFPRLAAIADLAWSPAARHDWTAFQSDSRRKRRAGRRWASISATCRRLPGGRRAQRRLTLRREDILTQRRKRERKGRKSAEAQQMTNALSLRDSLRLCVRH